MGRQPKRVICRIVFRVLTTKMGEGRFPPSRVTAGVGITPFFSTSQRIVSWGVQMAGHNTGKTEGALLDYEPGVSLIPD